MPGTAGLTEIFTDDAAYLHSPYEEPVAGLEAIGRRWEADRDGPDEVFTFVRSMNLHPPCRPPPLTRPGLE